MAENCCGGATLASDVWLRTLATVVSHNASDPHGTPAGNLWDFSSWVPDGVVVNLGTNDNLNGRPGLVPEYNATYKKLVLDAAEAYTRHGAKAPHFFLAVGPMSDACVPSSWCRTAYDTDACPAAQPQGATHRLALARCRYYNEVEWVLAEVTAPRHNLKASLLDQRGFLDVSPVPAPVLRARAVGFALLTHRRLAQGKHGPACCGHPGSTVDLAMSANGTASIKSALGWV